MECAEYKIRFLYSFLLVGADLGALSSRLRAGASFLEELPRPRAGFAPYLALSAEEAVFQFSGRTLPRNADIRFDECDAFLSATINYRFHLNRSGASVAVISLSFADPPPSFEVMVRLTSIGEKTGFLLSVRQEDQTSELSLWSIFKALLRTLLEFAEKDGLRLECLDDPATASGLTLSEERSAPFAPQSPFPLILLRYKDPKAFLREVRSAVPTNRPLGPLPDSAKKLLALLFRFKTPEEWLRVDDSYVRREPGFHPSILTNLHLHEDLFVALHHRSCLVCDLTRPDRQDLELFDFFVPSLEACLSELRARWHAYILSSELFDRSMSSATLQEDIHPGQLLDQLVSFRSLLLRIFDATVSHRFASGTLAELYEYGAQFFNLPELRQQAITKVNLLEGLFRTIQQREILNLSDL